MATVKEVFALLFTADGKAAVAEMGRLGDAAERDLGRAAKAGEDMGKKILAVSAATAAAGATVSAVLRSTSNAYVDNGREVMKLQRTTGAAAEDASRLVYAAKQSGVGVDQLSAAVVKLSRATDTTGGKNALKALGVDMEDAQGKARPLIEVIGDAADRVSALSNGDRKNDIVTTLFGKNGASLLPLLNKGSEGIGALADEADRLGLTFSDVDIAQVKALTKAQKELAAARAGLTNQVGREVTPYITEAEAGIARLATSAVEQLQSVPAGLKQVLAQLAVVGSGGATVLGTVGTVAWGLNEAASAGSLLRGHLRNADGSISNMAKGSAALAVAAVGFGYAWAENNRQFEETLATMTEIATLQSVLASFDPQNQHTRATATQVAAGLLQQQEVGPTSALDKIKDRFGIYWEGDEAENRQELANKLLEETKVTLSGLSSTQARQYLDEINRSMQLLGGSSKEVDELLGPLYDQLDRQEAAKRATDAANELAGGLDTLGDAADKNAPKIAALNSGIEGMLSFADASDRLSEAQKKQSEILTSNTPAVISAYDQLTKAQQRLQDVMDEDKGRLSQISPEEELRRARARLDDANRRLEARPFDARATSDKDEALADIESASRRRQELARAAHERAEAVSSAQSDVASARRQLDEALSHTGAGSAEYAAASRDVVRAQLEAEASMKDFAQAVIDGKVPVDEMRAKLKEWEDQGILTHEAVKVLNDELDRQLKLALLLAEANSGQKPGDFFFRMAAPGRAVQERDNWFTKAGEHGQFVASLTNPQNQAPVWGPGGVPTAGGLPVTGSRASGGDVAAGMLYRVNEHGQQTEYFRPGVDGHVIPIGEQRSFAQPWRLPPATTPSAPAPQPQQQRPAVTETHEHLHLHEVARPAEAADILVRERRKRAYLLGTSG